MDCCQPQNNKCACNTGCCGDVNISQVAESKTIIIDFLYLDLDICTRCQGADEGLDEAIEDVAEVLQLTGTEVEVNKIHINSKEMAIQHKFIGSPTIRVNGKDIQMEVRESLVNLVVIYVVILLIVGYGYIKGRNLMLHQKQ